MCKSTAAKSDVTINQLESTSVEFHSPTLVQSILATLGIIAFLFMLYICMKHFGWCHTAELATSRYNFNRWIQPQPRPLPPVAYHAPSAPPQHLPVQLQQQQMQQLPAANPIPVAAQAASNPVF